MRRILEATSRPYTLHPTPYTLEAIQDVSTAYRVGPYRTMLRRVRYWDTAGFAPGLGSRLWDRDLSRRSAGSTLP
eukprot:3940260-Rhodomonas_salina.1